MRLQGGNRPQSDISDFKLLSTRFPFQPRALNSSKTSIMSPSQAGQRPPDSANARHSRNNSGTASPLPTSKTSSKRQPDAALPATERKVHYTLIVRLPFPRGAFEDPPQVDWNADKDRKLWRIIANTPKIGDLNWEEVANDLGVELNFVLQQAAWLYQRHMDNVREQMRKVGASTTAGGSGAPTPIPGQQSVAGGIPMKRMGSGGSSRAPSSLSVRQRDSPMPGVRGSEVTMPGSPRPQGMAALSFSPLLLQISPSTHIPAVLLGVASRLASQC
jgi:Atg29 N-terminal domain